MMGWGDAMARGKERNYNEALRNLCMGVNVSITLTVLMVSELCTPTPAILGFTF